MALAALVGAYETSDSGGLRALVPLAGRPLADFQVRSLAAVGAAPIVLLADRPPEALLTLVDQLRGEGLPVILAKSAEEAAARFEADHSLILLADGIAPDMADLSALSVGEGAAVLTVPDDEAHEAYERIDLAYRWAGLARMSGEDVGSTAAMLGDWDLPSTLLRRAIQAGAALEPASEGGSFLVDSADDGSRYTERLLGASRAARVDWVARWPMAPLEDWLTVKFSAWRLKPALVATMTPVLVGGAALSFITGQLLLGAILLILSMPFDLIGRRIGSLRLKPIVPGKAGERWTWPLFLCSIACLSFALFRSDAQWGILVLGAATLIIAHLGKVVRALRGVASGDVLTFRRRPASMVLLPFAIGGWWLAGLAALLAYAALSALWSAHAPKG